MFDFQRITLFCLEKRLSRQIVTIVSKYLGGMAPLTPLATPMLNLFPKPWYWDQPRKTLKHESPHAKFSYKLSGFEPKMQLNNIFKEMYYVNNGDPFCP